MTIDITFTWHLILMLIVSIALWVLIFYQFAEHDDWGILTAVPIFLFMCLIWGIYGGIYWW